ncbi:MAG: hypothetical protein J5890_05670 [Clostridia bacterium]|nr:hypothetical protein [Clostridia bacterium]
MKKSAKLVSLLLAVMMVMVAFAACTDIKQSDVPETSEAANTEAANTQTEGTETTEGTENTEAAPADYRDVTGVDFSNPTIVINANDYDSMSDFARKMQNFEIEEGTIVEINGFEGASTMTHSIVVPNADNSESIGTTYEVAGDYEYPAEDTPIHITGVVRMGEYYRLIVVPADLIEVSAAE